MCTKAEIVSAQSEYPVDLRKEQIARLAGEIIARVRRERAWLLRDTMPRTTQKQPRRRTRR